MKTLGGFAVLLPLLELALWLVLVPTRFALLYLPSNHTSLDSKQSSHSTSQIDALSFYIQPDHITLFALEMICRSESEVISAINLPGVIPEVLISLPTTWPSMWKPTNFSAQSWRCLAYPFYCLPFWWFVGRGLDNIIRSKKQHWGLLLVGTVLTILFSVFWVGLQFSQYAADRSGTGTLRGGLLFWALAFGIFPFEWIRQWRIRSSRATNAT